MTIEQHAEAAAKDIASWLRLNAHLFPSFGNQADWAKLIQLRIDEATAQLKGTIAAQDERQRLAGERCGIHYEQYGCDWPEWVADEVLKLRSRIAALEWLGPLIERMQTLIVTGYEGFSFPDNHDEEYDMVQSEINAILRRWLVRPRPGSGWKQLSESVWENASNGVRIHALGLIYDRAGGVPEHMRLRWSNHWPLSVEWDRHTAIAGGNRKRGLMTLALEIVKGGEP